MSCSPAAERRKGRNCGSSVTFLSPKKSSVASVYSPRCDPVELFAVLFALVVSVWVVYLELKK